MSNEDEPKWEPDPDGEVTLPFLSAIAAWLTDRPGEPLPDSYDDFVAWWQGRQPNDTEAQ